MIGRGVVMAVARDLRDVVGQGRALWTLRARSPKAVIDRSVRVTGDPARISLGAGVTISGPSSIVVLDGGGLSGSRLAIGEGTYVGEFANLRTAGAPISIGAHCLIAQSVTIVGSNHGTGAGARIVDQPWSGDGVEIGDDVWIASNCVVVAGARIGSGAVIAANSVVRGEVPAKAIVAGSPARQVGERRP
jgi:acetyltransferase-like isoleucine patch superfamily enzyme